MHQMKNAIRPQSRVVAASIDRVGSSTVAERTSADTWRASEVATGSGGATGACSAVGSATTGGRTPTRHAGSDAESTGIESMPTIATSQTR